MSSVDVRIRTWVLCLLYNSHGNFSGETGRKKTKLKREKSHELQEQPAVICICAHPVDPGCTWPGLTVSLSNRPNDFSEEKWIRPMTRRVYWSAFTRVDNVAPGYVFNIAGIHPGLHTTSCIVSVEWSRMVKRGRNNPRRTHKKGINEEKDDGYRGARAKVCDPAEGSFPFYHRWNLPAPPPLTNIPGVDNHRRRMHPCSAHRKMSIFLSSSRILFPHQFFTFLFTFCFFTSFTATRASSAAEPRKIYGG